MDLILIAYISHIVLGILARNIILRTTQTRINTRLYSCNLAVDALLSENKQNALMYHSNKPQELNNAQCFMLAVTSSNNHSHQRPSFAQRNTRLRNGSRFIHKHMIKN